MPSSVSAKCRRVSCGEPDIVDFDRRDFSREEMEKAPPNCLCCGSKMSVVDPPTEGQNIGGEYRFVCPVCPKPADLADF